jgi:hypothetical protein
MYIRMRICICIYIQLPEYICMYTGYVWRAVLQALILMSVDEVNVLRYTRGLQLSLPFLTGYEAYIIDQVIEALERNITLEKEKKALLSAPVSKNHAARVEDNFMASELYRDLHKSVKDLKFVLSVAFCNRNVSRILVQQMVRYDILWHLNSQFNWYICIFICVSIYKYID